MDYLRGVALVLIGKARHYIIKIDLENMVKKIREQKRQSSQRRRRELRIWLQNIKTSQGCIKCGEKHPACLSFHHLNPSDKKLHFGKQYSYARSRYEEELRKCVIMCENCHRKLHWENIEIGRPEEQPEIIIDPIEDPMRREAPIPDTIPIEVPELVPV